MPSNVWTSMKGGSSFHRGRAVLEVYLFTGKAAFSKPNLAVIL